MPRAKKICAKPGCPSVAVGSYCVTHNREADKARGSREQRGYGKAHIEARGRWAPVVEAGAATCARCKQPILSSDTWALDHDDNDRTLYLGPSHSRCNNSAGGKRRHGLTN